MLTGLCVTVAVLLSMLGLVFASQATVGVGLIAVGCLLAIVGRIAQAQHYHRELHPLKGTADPARVYRPGHVE